MSTVASIQSKSKSTPVDVPFGPLTPKGVSDTKDSLITSKDNVLYDIANAVCSREKTSNLTHITRLSEVQGMSRKMLEIEKEVAEVIKHLDQAKKTQPLLEATKKIAKSFSAAVNAIIGFEMLSVGAPIVGSVFLTSAALAGADLAGFFKNYKTYLDGLSIASSVAAIGAGSYANALSEITPRMVSSGIFFLDSVVKASLSFNQSNQNRCKAEYFKLQDAQKKVEFSLSHFIKEIEQSFEKEEQLRKNIQYHLLINRNLE